MSLELLSAPLVAEELDAEELLEDALAEPDADALALESEDAPAEAVADALADADALAELLWLSAGALMLELHAARPRVAARLRDRTAIDFFTVFSFLVDPRAMPGRPIVWLFVE